MPSVERRLGLLINSLKIFKQKVCVRGKAWLAARASHYGEIALSSSRRLRSALAAAQIISSHNIFMVAKTSGFTEPLAHWA
jgi:hypothetical protein